MAKKKVKRVGILTGGGDCPGLNAVIRAVAKTAMNVHDIDVYGVADGYLGLIKNQIRKLENLDVSGILAQGGTILGTSNRDNPFRFFDRGAKTPKDVSNQAIGNFRKHKLDALICIGGDGTLSIAYEIFKKGVPVVGVPKTIDNDISETDYTFGFNTAVTMVMTALDNLHTTASSHHRVIVVEVMGRYAGWIALEGGISGGGDCILLPEIPYKIERVCEKVLERSKFGKRFSLVVASEGAKPKGGEMVVKKVLPTSTDPLRLGGIGMKIADDIERLTGLESRVVVLGHLQRGGSPTAFDRILASRYGFRALELVARGRFGYIPALKGNRIIEVPIERAKKIKLVPRKHPLINAARALGTCFGD